MLGKHLLKSKVKTKSIWSSTFERVTRVLMIKQNELLGVSICHFEKFFFSERLFGLNYAIISTIIIMV